MTLNRYGLLALDFCRRHQPSTWAARHAPIPTFETIGEEIQSQVTRTRDELLGPPRSGEHPLDLERRSSQALSTAEELVFADHPAFVPEAITDPGSEHDPALSEAWTTLAAVNRAIHQHPR
jgi:hypothetical protein